MARGRGRRRERGRGRGRGAQESHETQDYPCTRLRSRYPTRNSTGGVSPQSMAVPPSGSINSNLCLEAVLRIHKRKRETAEAELPHGSSQPTGEDPVLENSVEDGTHSISVGSPSYCGSFTQHEIDLDGFCAELDVDGDVQPPREISVCPRDEHILGKITAIDVPLNSQCQSPSRSLNLTEFVRGLKDDSDDDGDEVESAPGLGYDYVHGHKVKIEFAGLLGAIFRRYGDITVECNVKSHSLLSLFLERLCVVYQTLEKKTLSNLKHDQINDMLNELHTFRTLKLNVEWLLERLDQISETRSKKYLAVKEEAVKCMESICRIDKDLEHRRRHIDLLQMKISALETEKLENQAMISALEQKKVENQAKADECRQMAIDIKTRINALANQSLVHGLL